MSIARSCCLAIMAAMLVGGASLADAGLIVLSEFSSDETPADLLDATLEFSVSGSMLTLTVTNLTDTNDPPAEYDLSLVAFNATSPVENLTLLSGLSGWSLRFLQDPGQGDGHGVGGFGRFDAILERGTGQDPVIAPGEAAVFTFEIDGTASQDSFTSELSRIPPGDAPMLVAAKFISGPDGDSAFGAVPEPGSALLVVAGAAALAGQRARRRPSRARR